MRSDRIKTMDRTQAAKIQGHLMDASDAIHRANEIIVALDENDRAAFSLREIISTLHFELLHEIYIRYPDLRPPTREIPVINTVRRWEEIVLPESISESDLDTIIFSTLGMQWRKTAMVIGNAL